jgi:uncharacterized protein YaaR (DUF327 family)
MARNEKEKRKGGAPVVEAPGADGQPENLDKVRDILFGGQMRAVETRMQNLEERLRREHQSLRGEVAKQMGELEALIKGSAQELGDRLTAERTRRTEEIKSLAAEIKETLRALEKRHVKLEEATSMADAGLRDQLLLQAKAATAELAKLGERLGAELSRSHQELVTTKTDSAVLAGLLSDLAVRIGGQGERKSGPRG